MAGIRDAKLGRIAFPTVFDDLREVLGGSVQAAGAAVVPGETQLATFPLSIPLHGTTGDLDEFSVGDTLRRQFRSLLSNQRALLRGQYLRLVFDSELNCWLVTGGGTIEYVNGGPTFGEYKLTLGDTYVVGQRRSAREARRIEAFDRRLSTTERDFKGLIYGTSFAHLTGVLLAYLPAGATDITGYNQRAVITFPAPWVGGTLPATVNLVDGEVASFERAEAMIGGLDDVVVYDRRGLGDLLAPFAVIVRQLGPAGFWRLGDAIGAGIMVDSSRHAALGEYVGAPTLGQPSLVSGAPDDTAAGLSDLGYGRVIDNGLYDLTGDLTVGAMISPRRATGDPLFATETGGQWASDAATGFSLTDGIARLQVSEPGVFTMRRTGDVDPVGGTEYTVTVDLDIADAAAVSASVAWYSAGEVLLAVDPFDIVEALGEQTLSGTVTAPGGAARAELVLEVTATSVTPSMTVVFDPFSDDISFPMRNPYLGQADVSVTSVTAPGGAVDLVDGILSKGASLAGAYAYRFGMDLATNELVFGVSDDGDEEVLARSGDIGLLRGVAQLVGVSYRAADGECDFYRNGLLVATADGLPTSIYSNSRQLTVGKWEADS
jgi:hypothetical protein